MELSGTTTPAPDAFVATPVSVTTAAPPASWRPVTRFGFHIAFLYFFCFIFLSGNGTLFGVFPVVGGWIQGKLNWPVHHLSEFIGQHLFHLTGIAAHWHPSESGDTAMNWIQNGLFLTFALAGGILWTFIAILRNNPRTEYRTLHSWLRFLLRLTCAMFMVTYGLAKVFPLQMPPPSIAVLNEPVGNLSPMTLLWNLIGLNPVYEMICGSAELLGGILLLYRRTALAGALFSAFVMANVVFYNFCYDVPVKIFAVNLLLGCIFLTLPDALSLGRFFWSHKAATASATWVPAATRRAGRIAVLVTEIVFAVAFLVVQPIFMSIGWHHLQAAVRTPSPLVGAWHLDATHPASGAFVDPEGRPITDLYVAPSGRAYTRSTDGELWLSGVNLDAKKHTVRINCYFIGPPTNYAWQLTDPNHLILTSVPPEPPKPHEEEARLAALRTFGNFVAVREQTHETWAWATIERLWQDFHRALRSARRAPLLSSVAVLALALGIGLNTGVFSIVNALFLRVPTRVDPASFVQVCPQYTGWFAGSDKNASFTTEDFDAIRSRSHTLREVAPWRQYFAFFEQGNRYIGTLLAGCNYFHVLGIDHPRMGRFFAPGECNRGAGAQVTVLSETLWKSQFDADPRIVGRVINLNGVPVTVIGVAPSDAANLLLAAIFLPYTLAPQLDHSGDLLDSPDKPWLSMSGRLRPGFTRADAQAELTAIMSQQDRAYVQRKVFAFNRKTSLVVIDGSEIENPAIHELAALMLALMLGPLALVLLLACSNVATLFLSRTIARRGEIAVRLALGVSRSRLAGMLLMESLLIVCIGGALSMVLAYRVPLMILNAMAHGQANFAARLNPDWRVFAYLAILMVAATVLSSLVPIRAAWKLDLLTALKGREGTATVRSRTTSGLIVTQVALGFVLVCAAVIFGRMPGLIRSVNPGFEIHQVLNVPLRADTSENNREKAQVFYRELETKILALPGVQSLAYASLQPFNQSPPGEIRLPRQTKGTGRPASVDEVSDGFFSSFGIRVLRGRLFLPTDTTPTGAAPVAVVSRTFANDFWPGSDPIGQKVIMPDDRYLTVVGVVADTRSERFGRLDGPRLYMLRGPSALGGNLYVRVVGSAKPLENAIREAVKRLDPVQTIAPQTIWESLEDHAESMTTMAEIILVVASIALLMAVTGVYCVLSFAVNQRTREFGIKMVLGASRGEIFRLVLLRAVKNITIGLIGGLALAEPAMLLLNRLLARSPFPLHRFDSTVFGISAILLAAVSLIAMYIPATRAMRTDPMRVLRTE